MEMTKQSGFSILETVMASAVLSIGLLGLMGMFTTGYKALDSGHALTIATKLARDQMEKLRVTAPVRIEKHEESLKNGMKRSWSVLQDSTDPNIWIITVRVSWKTLGGQPREYKVHSFRAS